jgi:hypothetical protein
MGQTQEPEMTPNPDDPPETIFTNTSALGLMAEAEAMRRWHEAGGGVAYYYGPSESWPALPGPTWVRGGIYRAVRPALIPASADWSHLLLWVKAVAWDKDGTCFGWEWPPTTSIARWHYGGRFVALTATPGLIRGNGPWTQAIVIRPEGA